MSTVLVTVGTTKFDELIQAVDNAEFIAAVKDKGYSRLLVQRGNGSYTPTLLGVPGKGQGISIECFDYQPNLASTIASADLVISHAGERFTLNTKGASAVISHAGSGSIFEGLSAGRPLIVVPNERLMANHQVELAAQLERMQHLVYATPSTLTTVLQQLDVTKLQPYVKGNPDKVAQAITQAVFS